MMQWGFEANRDTLQLCYGNETWYDTSALCNYVKEREQGHYYVKGDVLWHVQLPHVTRMQTGTSIADVYTVDEEGLVTVSKDALYICNGKDCKRAYNNTYDMYKTFPNTPNQIIYSEAGILYQTAAGFYTPEGQFLTRDIDLFDTDKGVFVGVTPWGIKIWFTASWQMHHRISLPGKAVDVACTVPWVCVVTRKDTCSIWNVRSGDAYRQWSVTSPRAVAIDHAAQVTICTREDIKFFDEVGTCLYAQKIQKRSIKTSNDSMWLCDDDISLVRPVDTWPLLLCMWCETPLSLPFPAPPPYLIRPVEDIIDALREYWLPRSFENLASERDVSHALDFTQIVCLDAWQEAFFEYASLSDWTSVHAEKTYRRLVQMHIPIQTNKWANVRNREPNNDSFQLWDILFKRIDETCTDVIELACAHENDQWLATRAMDCALYVVHPYLISFLPVDRFLCIMAPNWNEWIPVFLEWIKTNQNITSRRMWRIFLKEIAAEGPITYYPEALRTMDVLSSWKHGHLPGVACIDNMYCFDPSFHPTKPIIEDALLDTPHILSKHVDVLINLVSALMEHIYAWHTDLKDATYLSVLKHEEIMVWTSSQLFRRNNYECTATSNDQKLPLEIDTCDDYVCEVYEHYINVYKCNTMDVSYRFERRDILSACYMDVLSIWTLSRYGVLECIHAMNGKCIHQERILFLQARKMVRDHRMIYIICAEHIYVYDTSTRKLHRTIEASHVCDVTRIFDRLAIVYEDNTLCYENSHEVLYTSEFRFCHVQEMDGHVFIINTISMTILDAEWNEVYEHSFPSMVADVCICENIYYILLRDGTIHAMQWNRMHIMRIQEILFDLPAHHVQQFTEKTVALMMMDTTLHDDIRYLRLVEKIMKDRTKWKYLLREDVCKWLLQMFFKKPTDAWTPLWKLFSYRGTTIKCVICQSSTVTEDNPLVLLQCGHRYHKECIDNLRNSHESRNAQLLNEYALTADLLCPSCRAPLGTPYDDRLCTLLALYESDEDA